MSSGGVITDRTLGCLLEGAPSAEGPSVVVVCVKGSSECGAEAREMALTTHWREGREGKSCNSSLRTKISLHDYKSSLDISNFLWIKSVLLE